MQCPPPPPVRLGAILDDQAYIYPPPDTGRIILPVPLSHTHTHTHTHTHPWGQLHTPGSPDVHRLLGGRRRNLFNVESSISSSKISQCEAVRRPSLNKAKCATFHISHTSGQHYVKECVVRRHVLRAHVAEALSPNKPNQRVLYICRCRISCGKQ